MNTNHNWHLIDANNQVLGRIASRAAQLIMGKHKPGFVRHQDNGDFVVVINAKSVAVTGRKEDQKIYNNYSGYPGGLRQRTLKVMRATHPDRIIERAVFGMLPKNRLLSKMKTRLKVFTDDQHPYSDKLKLNNQTVANK